MTVHTGTLRRHVELGSAFVIVSGFGEGATATGAHSSNSANGAQKGSNGAPFGWSTGNGTTLCSSAPIFRRDPRGGRWNHGNLSILAGEYQTAWACLEPGAQLADRLQQLLASKPLPVPVRVTYGRAGDLASVETFDTIPFIDVLEHCRRRPRGAARWVPRLRSGGPLIVLAPALNLLFSPFDRAIGHFRRDGRVLVPGRSSAPLVDSSLLSG